MTDTAAEHAEDREPTDDEMDRTRRAALTGAWQALRRLPLHADEMNVDTIRRGVLEAMRAARAHAIAANGDASLYIDTVHVVATALWWVQATGPEELPADVDPYSRAGEAFIGFAAAVQLLEACSQLQQLTDYAGEFSEGYVDEALAACAAAEEEA